MAVLSLYFSELLNEAMSELNRSEAKRRAEFAASVFRCARYLKFAFLNGVIRSECLVRPLIGVVA
jgi:hypothetical protein